MIRIKDILLEDLDATLKKIITYKLSDAELLKYHKLFMTTMKNDYGELYNLLSDISDKFIADQITVDEYFDYKQKLRNTKFKHLSFSVFRIFCEIILRYRLAEKYNWRRLYYDRD